MASAKTRYVPDERPLTLEASLRLPEASAQAAFDDVLFNQESAYEEQPVILRPRVAISFAFEIGHLVQPAPAVQAPVVWRGQVKVRRPETGLVHRVNVYRLADGFWDCYYEEELQAA